jgi:hypothetical protein
VIVNDAQAQLEETKQDVQADEAPIGFAKQTMNTDEFRAQTLGTAGAYFNKTIID